MNEERRNSLLLTAVMLFVSTVGVMLLAKLKGDIKGAAALAAFGAVVFAGAVAIEIAYRATNR